MNPDRYCIILHYICPVKKSEGWVHPLKVLQSSELIQRDDTIGPYSYQQRNYSGRARSRVADSSIIFLYLLDVKCN